MVEAVEVHRVRLVEEVVVVEVRRAHLGAAAADACLVEVVDVHRAALVVTTHHARLVEAVEVCRAPPRVAACRAPLMAEVGVHHAPLGAVAHCARLVVEDHVLLAAESEGTKVDKKMNLPLSKWNGLSSS